MNSSRSHLTKPRQKQLSLSSNVGMLFDWKEIGTDTNLLSKGDENPL
jgi:hypothetical protein